MGFNDGRAGFTAEQQRGGIALRIAADEQHFLPLLRHHVGQIGEGETLADSPLPVDGDDLGPDPGSFRTGEQVAFSGPGRVLGDRFIHACSCLQSSTIFRQSGSSKAVR